MTECLNTIKHSLSREIEQEFSKSTINLTEVGEAIDILKDIAEIEKLHVETQYCEYKLSRMEHEDSENIEDAETVRMPR